MKPRLRVGAAPYPALSKRKPEQIIGPHGTQTRTEDNRKRRGAAELAGRYAGKAQEGRLLFLAWLKETPGSTIGQAARAAGLSERQGRYLWDDYCAGGLERVIGRRVYQPKGEKKRVRSASVPSAGTVAGMTAADMVAFMNAVGELGRIDDPYKWARRLGDLLMEFVPEVDYAVVSISHNPISRRKPYLIFHQHCFPDRDPAYLVEAMDEMKYENEFDKIIEHGVREGFPFSKYHAPPFGLDIHSQLHDRSGERLYMGSVLLLRNAESDCLSSDTSDFLREILPLLELVYTEYVLRLHKSNPAGDIFSTVLDQVAANRGLSGREMDVLILLLIGHTHDEIAALLNVTRATVNKHTRSVFRKAGVRRLSEFFARYFTPRNYFPEPENRGADEGSGVEE